MWWLFFEPTVFLFGFGLNISLLKPLVAANPLPLFQQLVALVELPDVLLVLLVFLADHLAGSYRRI